MFTDYYLDWCKTNYDCDGIQTRDRGICRNTTLWENRPCGPGSPRGVCKETPGRCVFMDTICNGLVSETEEGSCGYLDFRYFFCIYHDHFSNAFFLVMRYV